MSRFWASPILATAAGLVLLSASAAGWVSGESSRDVGGVTVTEPFTVSGTDFAPAAVVVGLVGLVGGAALAVARGRPRLVAGAVVVAVGIAGLVVVARGISAASDAEGALTAAPLFALTAAAALTTAGAVVARSPVAPPATSRYRVEGEQPDDDEWSLASEDE